MKYACQYAIARFMPFVETGEFANVGIVLMCPEIGYFNFQLLNKVRRITAFFNPLDASIYRGAKNDLRDELLRLKAQMESTQQSGNTAKYMFQELVRPREVMLRFDDPRVVLTNNPEKKLDDLFNYYVERDFVTPDYIEQRLEKRMRGLLIEASVRELYHEARVEHGAFHARFPFAHKNQAGSIVKAIKPIHLAHKDPALAYEHGWSWVGKIRQLQKYEEFPKHVLVAAQAPSEADEQAFSVYKEIREDFLRLKVQFAELADVEQIKSFARL